MGEFKNSRALLGQTKLNQFREIKRFGRDERIRLKIIIGKQFVQKIYLEKYSFEKFKILLEKIRLKNIVGAAD